MAEYQFGSILDRYFRVKLQKMADEVSTHGKTMQDLVAEGQLTHYQYSQLLTVINGLIKSGEVSKEDFSEDMIKELEGKLDKGDVSVDDINKNKGLFDGSFFTPKFLEDLNGGVVDATNVLDGSLTTQKYANKSVTGEKIDDKTVSARHFSAPLSERFEGFKAEYDEGVPQNRQLSAVLDASNITVANVPINVRFDYYTPKDNISKMYSFLWGESSGETRLSEASPLLDAQVDEITSFSYDLTFTEERDLLTLFIRKTVPDETASLLFIRNIVITINGVEYVIDNLNPYSSGGTVNEVVNLPMRLLTQDDLNKFKQEEAEAAQPLAGKTWMTFGDSITWYDKQPFQSNHVEFGEVAKGYQSYLEGTFGLSIINKGGSGYRLADNILGVIKAADYTGVDFVSITSGANDFRASKTVGTIAPIGSTFDETTFYGALQSAIEHILGINPTIKIYLITPIPGWDDNKGKMPGEYPQAFRDVAKLYGLPLCDWYYESTINDITKDVFIGDNSGSGYDLHPTNAGFKRMGEAIVGTVKTHEGI